MTLLRWEIFILVPLVEACASFHAIKRILERQLGVYGIGTSDFLCLREMSCQKQVSYFMEDTQLARKGKAAAATFYLNVLFCNSELCKLFYGWIKFKFRT